MLDCIGFAEPAKRPYALRLGWARKIWAMAFTLVLRPADDNLEKWAAKIDAVVRDKTLATAGMRAINHTGAKAFTRVRRELAGQTSAPREIITNSLKALKASTETLEYRITASGKALSLRHFRPRQFRAGVRAKVWGRLQTYPGTFIVHSIHGHVFRREGRSRLPIKILYGPNIAKEVVKDKTREGFEAVAAELAPRMEHEIRRLLKL